MSNIVAEITLNHSPAKVVNGPRKRTIGPSKLNTKNQTISLLEVEQPLEGKRNLFTY